jgi:hypothetical protein
VLTTHTAAAVAVVVVAVDDATVAVVPTSAGLGVPVGHEVVIRTATVIVADDAEVGFEV